MIRIRIARPFFSAKPELLPAIPAIPSSSAWPPPAFSSSWDDLHGPVFQPRSLPLLSVELPLGSLHQRPGYPLVPLRCRVDWVIPAQTRRVPSSVAALTPNSSLKLGTLYAFFMASALHCSERASFASCWSLNSSFLKPSSPTSGSLYDWYLERDT